MTPLKTIAEGVADYFLIQPKQLFQATAVPKHYYPRRLFVYIACVEYGHSTKHVAQILETTVRNIQNKKLRATHELRKKPNLENQIESIKELINELTLQS